MRFAFLITAHEEPDILKRLIKMLDYSDNDIYIHIDSKSNAICANELNAEFAKLTILQPQKLTWGGVSQICVTLNLLAEATKIEHDYYHLISGVDLPLVNHDDMIKFFRKNQGKEFIGITPNWAEKESISKRYKLHWFWQDEIGKKKNAFYLFSRIITKTESILCFKRQTKEKIKFYGGPSWFSITEPAAKLILDNASWIKTRFKDTICCDEIFAQTIIGNSDFYDKIYNLETGNAYEECLRYVRFNGTSPFILDINDKDKLVNSKCLFGKRSIITRQV